MDVGFGGSRRKQREVQVGLWLGSRGGGQDSAPLSPPPNGNLPHPFVMIQFLAPPPLHPMVCMATQHLQKTLKITCLGWAHRCREVDTIPGTPLMIKMGYRTYGVLW